MKPQPHDWTRLADIEALAGTRAQVGGSHRPFAPSALERHESASAGVPLASAVPRPVPAGAGIAAVLLALTAVIVCGQLFGHLNHGFRGPLLGAGLALALLLPLTLLQWRHGRDCAGEAAAARRQLATILGGLREGTFLLGRDLCLEAACSDSLKALLRLPAPAGRRFEDVLRPLLDAETLAASLTFLQLLWNDEADVDAIDSLNPLSQVEVWFANTQRGSERRYLSFAFRRAAGTRPADERILGLVADITDRVLLARELEQVEAEGDSQAELLLQLMRTDPVTLVSFLDAADDAFRKSNAMLTAGGIGQQHLRRKLNGVLRELDAIRLQADTLAFASFAHRLQSIDQVLSRLRSSASLAGNDFLPIVVRLDELMTHAATMRAIHQHIVLLRAASAALAARERDEASMISAPVALELS